MQMNESLENYLEHILIIFKKNGFVRSIDLAEVMGVTKASVSHSMKLLRENGYIEMDRNNLITLLPPGFEIADRMYERHSLLSRFLVSLGVSKETAISDACKIEHDISAETFEAICRHADGGMKG